MLVLASCRPLALVPRVKGPGVPGTTVSSAAPGQLGSLGQPCSPGVSGGPFVERTLLSRAHVQPPSSPGFKHLYSVPHVLCLSVVLPSDALFRGVSHLVTKLLRSLSRRMLAPTRAAGCRALVGSAAGVARPWHWAPNFLCKALALGHHCRCSWAHSPCFVWCFAAAALWCCPVPHVSRRSALVACFVRCRRHALQLLIGACFVLCLCSAAGTLCSCSLPHALCRSVVQPLNALFNSPMHLVA